MSTGTRLMLTADGPIVVCQRRRSGRWLRVQSQRRKAEALQTRSDDIPGTTIRRRSNARIWICARWDAFRSTHYPQVIVRSDAGRSEEHTSELQSLAYLVC